MSISREGYLYKVQEEILELIEKKQGINQKEIAFSMNISQKVAGYHLTKMEEMGVVIKELEGRISRYHLVKNIHN